ncbi:MAG TPA: Fur family transcriptional regulator [Bacillota bacterium]|nr:Fur family transcriptional regulator [Bacillota bacterium]
MDKRQAIICLQKKGYKTTDKRKDILHFFERANGYRTARDVNAYMEQRHPEISFDTVYRNLHLYHAIGILEATELNGEKLFRMKCSDDHHHHFICKDCGKTAEIDVCPMDHIGNALANYYIEDHKFEIYGLCPACQRT